MLQHPHTQLFAEPTKAARRKFSLSIWSLPAKRQDFTKCSTSGCYFTLNRHERVFKLFMCFTITERSVPLVSETFFCRIKRLGKKPFQSVGDQLRTSAPLAILWLPSCSSTDSSTMLRLDNSLATWHHLFIGFRKQCSLLPWAFMKMTQFWAFSHERKSNICMTSIDASVLALKGAKLRTVQRQKVGT